MSFDNNVYIKWLDNLKSFWKLKDVKSILTMFDNNVEYYETPFELLKDNKNLAKLELVWHDIDEHDIKKLNYKVLGYKENGVIVNFILELDNKIIDMIYDIKLNEDEKCVYFKQWYMDN